MRRPAQAVIVHGVVAGLLAGLVVALWFLVADTVAGHPFMTPRLLAGMLLGSGAVAALASSHAPSLTVRQARLTEGTPKHPQGVRLSASLGWQGNSASSQPTVTKLDVWFPGGTRYNGGSYPSCSYQRLNAAGPNACPKGSVMGSGTGLAYADTVVTRPQITVVNGGRDRVYFYTVLNNPARVQVPRQRLG